jgi:hypothetical protein
VTPAQWCYEAGLTNPVYDITQFPNEGQLLEFTQLYYEQKDGATFVHEVRGSAHFLPNGKIYYLKEIRQRTLGLLYPLNDHLALAHLDPRHPLPGEVYFMPPLEIPINKKPYSSTHWRLWAPFGLRAVPAVDGVRVEDTSINVRLPSIQFTVGRLEDGVCRELGLPAQRNQILALVSSPQGTNLYNLETQTVLATGPHKPITYTSLYRELKEELCIFSSLRPSTCNSPA